MLSSHSAATNNPVWELHLSGELSLFTRQDLSQLSSLTYIIKGLTLDDVERGKIGSERERDREKKRDDGFN